MKPENQNTAIANACGWERIYRRAQNERGLPDYIGLPPDAAPLTENYCVVPDYCNDLNAICAAVETLSTAQKLVYGDILNNITSSFYDDYYDGWCAGHGGEYIFSGAITHVSQATAAQRAEAFLRTIGKWEGGAS